MPVECLIAGGRKSTATTGTSATDTSASHAALFLRRSFLSLCASFLKRYVMLTGHVKYVFPVHAWNLLCLNANIQWIDSVCDPQNGTSFFVAPDWCLMASKGSDTERMHGRAVPSTAAVAVGCRVSLNVLFTRSWPHSLNCCRAQEWFFLLFF